MPIDVKQTGPLKIGDNKVYIQRHIIKRWWDTKCSDEPVVNEVDHVPPECSERKEWTCRRIRYEKYKIRVLEADKKTSWAWYVGAAVVTIGLCAIGLGVVALIGLAVDAAFVTGVSAAVVWSGIAAGGVTTVGGSAIVRLNPDEYEPGDLVTEEGPEVEEIDSENLPNRRSVRRWNCRQQTGENSGNNSSESNQEHEGEGH